MATGEAVQARTFPHGVTCWVDTAQSDVDAALAFYGAAVVTGPADARAAGRTSTLTDAEGVPFRLGQARRRLRVQVANEPGASNFSDLHIADPESAAAFYGPAFDWTIEDQGWSTSIRVPGLVSGPP